MPDFVRFERHGRIGHVILDRPEKLNAMTDAMLAELRQALVALDRDPEAWVGIVHGTGRSFCSGADVQDRQMKPPEELARMGGGGAWETHLPDFLFRMGNWKPMIAAVHGHVLGMGLRLALLCEFVVAAPETQFRITETSRGLDSTTLWSLVARRSGTGFANDVAMTGRYWTSEEAAEIHLIDRLSAPGDHLREAVSLANQIAQNPPLAVRAVVEAGRGELEQLELRRRLTRPRGLQGTHDFQEALHAYLEDREPHFDGT